MMENNEYSIEHCLTVQCPQQINMTPAGNREGWPGVATQTTVTPVFSLDSADSADSASVWCNVGAINTLAAGSKHEIFS